MKNKKNTKQNFPIPSRKIRGTNAHPTKFTNNNIGKERNSRNMKVQWNDPLWNDPGMTRLTHTSFHDPRLQVGDHVYFRGTTWHHTQPKWVWNYMTPYIEAQFVTTLPYRQMTRAKLEDYACVSLKNRGTCYVTAVLPPFKAIVTAIKYVDLQTLIAAFIREKHGRKHNTSMEEQYQKVYMEIALNQLTENYKKLGFKEYTPKPIPVYEISWVSWMQGNNHTLNKVFNNDNANTLSPSLLVSRSAEKHRKFEQGGNLEKKRRRSTSRSSPSSSNDNNVPLAVRWDRRIRHGATTKIARS